MGLREIVKRLTVHQREALVAHVPGPVPVDRRCPSSEAQARRKSTKVLMDRELVRGDSNDDHPKQTRLTESGREAAAIVLAGYAEALVKAGCLEAMPVSLSPTASDERTAVIAQATNALTDH